MASDQAPIHSGYSARSTADDVIAGLDLSGKTAIEYGVGTTVTLQLPANPPENGSAHAR